MRLRFGNGQERMNGASGIKVVVVEEGDCRGEGVKVRVLWKVERACFVLIFDSVILTVILNG